MARVVIRPVSRTVAPGSLATFAVQADGGDGLTLLARACDDATGYHVSLGDQGQETVAGRGPVALAVSVPPDAHMA